MSSANLAGTSNEGILIPRLTAARVTAIAAPQEGTLVYVTDTPSGVKFSANTKGFYYWDAAASQWQKLIAGAADNIYKADGTVSTNRVVSVPSSLTFLNTNSSANVTFNGGTLMLLSGIVNNTRELTFSNAGLQQNDFTLYKSSNTENLVFTLPTGVNNGRRLCMSNYATAGTLTVKGLPNSSETVLQPTQGRCFHYTGSIWLGL